MAESIPSAGQSRCWRATIAGRDRRSSSSRPRDAVARAPLVEADEQRPAPEEPRRALAPRLDERAGGEAEDQRPVLRRRLGAEPIGQLPGRERRELVVRPLPAELREVRFARGAAAQVVEVVGDARRPLVELVDADDADGEEQDERGARERAERPPGQGAGDSRRQRQPRASLHEVLRQFAAAVHRDRQARGGDEGRRDGESPVPGRRGPAARRTPAPPRNHSASTRACRTGNVSRKRSIAQGPE